MANELEHDIGPDERRLSEADARRLLERAIQLDAARIGETSVGELRRVAQELNVSPTAFAEALRELENKALSAAKGTTPSAARAQSLPPEPAGKKSWWRSAAIAVSGFLLGTSSLGPLRVDDIPNGIQIKRPLLLVDPGTLLLLAASVYLMSFHRRRTTAAEFQQDLLALWASVGLGSFAVNGQIWPPTLFVLAFGWLVCSAIGGSLVRRKSPEPTP